MGGGSEGDVSAEVEAGCSVAARRSGKRLQAKGTGMNLMCLCTNRLHALHAVKLWVKQWVAGPAEVLLGNHAWATNQGTRHMRNQPSQSG